MLNKSEEEHEAFTQQSYYLDHPSLVSLIPPRTNNNQWESSLTINRGSEPLATTGLYHDIDRQKIWRIFFQ